MCHLDPLHVELGLAAGFMSRDTPLHSGYLHRFEGCRIGALKRWRRRWAQIKYDGFLYVYRNDSVSEGEQSLQSNENYVFISFTFWRHPE